MKIDRESLVQAINENRLTQGTWDKETPCLMSAIAGRSLDECTSNGWPRWLAELAVWLFDNQKPSDIHAFAIEFTGAVEAAESRNADYDEIFKQFRLGSVLPIALEAVGDGDEPWRVACRQAVQWSIDNGGAVNKDASYASYASYAAVGAVGAGATAAADSVDAAAFAADAASYGAAAAGVKKMQICLMDLLNGKAPASVQ